MRKGRESEREKRRTVGKKESVSVMGEREIEKQKELQTKTSYLPYLEVLQEAQQQVSVEGEMCEEKQ